MAYSTQKIFMRIDPLPNRQRSSLAEEFQSETGIRTYLSCLDFRAWSLDPGERTQYLSDIVTFRPNVCCQSCLSNCLCHINTDSGDDCCNNNQPDEYINPEKEDNARGKEDVKVNKEEILSPSTIIKDADEFRNENDNRRHSGKTRSKDVISDQSILSFVERQPSLKNKGRNRDTASTSQISRPYNLDSSTLALILENERGRRETFLEEASFNISTRPLGVVNIASDGALARRAKIVKAHARFPNLKTTNYECGKHENMLQLIKAKGKYTTNAVTELLDQYLQKVEQFSRICNKKRLEKQAGSLSNGRIAPRVRKVDKTRENSILLKNKQTRPNLNLSFYDMQPHSTTQRTNSLPNAKPLLKPVAFRHPEERRLGRKHRVSKQKHPSILKTQNVFQMEPQDSDTFGVSNLVNSTHQFEQNQKIGQRATKSSVDNEANMKRENSDLFFHKPNSIFSYHRTNQALNSVRDQAEFMRSLELYTKQLNGAVGNLVKIIDEFTNVKGILGRVLNFETPIRPCHQPEDKAVARKPDDDEIPLFLKEQSSNIFKRNSGGSDEPSRLRRTTHNRSRNQNDGHQVELLERSRRTLKEIMVQFVQRENVIENMEDCKSHLYEIVKEHKQNLMNFESHNKKALKKVEKVRDNLNDIKPKVVGFAKYRSKKPSEDSSDLSCFECFNFGVDLDVADIPLCPIEVEGKFGKIMGEKVKKLENEISFLTDEIRLKTDLINAALEEKREAMAAKKSAEKQVMRSCKKIKIIEYDILKVKTVVCGKKNIVFLPYEQFCSKRVLKKIRALQWNFETARSHAQMKANLLRTTIEAKDRLARDNESLRTDIFEAKNIAQELKDHINKIRRAICGDPRLETRPHAEIVKPPSREEESESETESESPSKTLSDSSEQTETEVSTIDSVNFPPEIEIKPFPDYIEIDPGSRHSSKRVPPAGETKSSDILVKTDSAQSRGSGSPSMIFSISESKSISIIEKPPLKPGVSSQSLINIPPAPNEFEIKPHPSNIELAPAQKPSQTSKTAMEVPYKEIVPNPDILIPSKTPIIPVEVPSKEKPGKPHSGVEVVPDKTSPEVPIMSIEGPSKEKPGKPDLGVVEVVADNTSSEALIIPVQVPLKDKEVMPHPDDMEVVPDLRYSKTPIIPAEDPSKKVAVKPIEKQSKSSSEVSKSNTSSISKWQPKDQSSGSLPPKTPSISSSSMSKPPNEILSTIMVSPRDSIPSQKRSSKVPLLPNQIDSDGSKSSLEILHPPDEILSESSESLLPKSQVSSLPDEISNKTEASSELIPSQKSLTEIRPSPIESNSSVSISFGDSTSVRKSSTETPPLLGEKRSVEIIKPPTEGSVKRTITSEKSSSLMSELFVTDTENVSEIPKPIPAEEEPLIEEPEHHESKPLPAKENSPLPKPPLESDEKPTVPPNPKIPTPKQTIDRGSPARPSTPQRRESDTCAEWISRVKVLELQIYSLRNEMDEHQGNIRIYKSQISKLNLANEDANLEIIRLKEELNRLPPTQVVCDEWIKVAESRGNEIEALKAKIRDKAENGENGQSQELLIREIDELKQKLVKYQDDFEFLREVHSKCPTEADPAKIEDCTKWIRQVQDLGTEISLHKITIKQQENTIADLQMKYNDLLRLPATEEIQEKLTNCEEQLTNFKKQLDLVVNGKENDVIALLNKKLSKYEAENSNLFKTVDENCNEMEEFKRKLVEANLIYQREKKNGEDLTLQLKICQTDLNQCRNQLQDAVYKNAELSASRPPLDPRQDNNSAIQDLIIKQEYTVECLMDLQVSINSITEELQGLMDCSCSNDASKNISECECCCTDAIKKDIKKIHKCLKKLTRRGKLQLTGQLHLAANGGKPLTNATLCNCKEKSRLEKICAKILQNGIQHLNWLELVYLHSVVYNTGVAFKRSVQANPEVHLHLGGGDLESKKKEGLLKKINRLEVELIEAKKLIKDLKKGTQ